MLFEPVRAALPDRALLSEPSVDDGKTVALKRAGTNPAPLTGADEPAALQRTYVPKEGRQRHSEVARQLADARWSRPGAADHRPASRISQRVEEDVKCRRMLSHAAKYCRTELLSARAK